MKNWIKWFSGNHVAANFLMAAVLIAGFAAWFQLRKEVFPETSFDAVIISSEVGVTTPRREILMAMGSRRSLWRAMGRQTSSTTSAGRR